MNFQALCTFDLKNASRADYVTAYSELAKLGFGHTVQGASRVVSLPTTTVIGTFTGSSAATVRDNLRGRVVQAFSAQGFKFEIFIAVGGGDHTWGSHTV